MIELDKIYNEDCLEGMKQIADKSIDLVVTDPPYLFIKGGQSGKNKVVGSMGKHGAITAELGDFDGTKIYELCHTIKRLFKNNYNAYFFCSELQLVYYLDFARNNHLRYNVLIWDRQDQKQLSKVAFRSNIDYIVRIYGNGQGLRRIDEPSSFYSKIYSGKQPYQEGHPTEKPLPLIEKFIKLSSNKGDLILDPFMGSATTAIACIREKRHFVGFELNKEYYDKACKRIENELMQPTLF